MHVGGKPLVHPSLNTTALNSLKWNKLMFFLLIIALILAWPTYGLSLVAYFAVVAVGAYFRAQHTRLSAMAMRAMRTLQAGEGHPPSWVDNGTQSSAFIGATIDEAVRKGVPKPFIDTHFSAPEKKAAFLCMLGLIESQGASVRQQGIVATIYICETWKLKNDEVATKMRKIQELLKDRSVRSVISAFNKMKTYDHLEGMFTGFDEELVEAVEKCHEIAKEICSITGQDVAEVLTIAVSKS